MELFSSLAQDAQWDPSSTLPLGGESPGWFTHIYIYTCIVNSNLLIVNICLIISKHINSQYMVDSKLLIVNMCLIMVNSGNLYSDIWLTMIDNLGKTMP